MHDNMLKLVTIVNSSLFDVEINSFFDVEIRVVSLVYTFVHISSSFDAGSNEGVLQ